MDKCSLHDDHNSKTWSPVIDLQLHKQIRIASQAGLPRDAHCVVKSGDNEQQSYMRVGNDIRKTIKPIVARTIRYRQGILIENLNKPR